jgi:E3 ubiquitin-protein ligase RGLG
MGNQHDKAHHSPRESHSSGHSSARVPVEPPKFSTFRDKYETIEQVQDALRSAGLEGSSLIIGIDYTISNKDSGKNTFNGQSLHAIAPNQWNPYQQVIAVMGKTLEVFDDDKLIPVYGFGDKLTQDKSVFPFYPDRLCYTFQEVLTRYAEITPQVNMAGPTSFAPLIREAINIVKKTQAYHILIIVADGQVTPDSEYCQATNETRRAIVEASEYPLSIILVGVGDGPWEVMEEFDDELPQRRFDNFQFVDFFKTMQYGGATPQAQEVSFALAALQEIPEQYTAIRQHNLWNNCK